MLLAHQKSCRCTGLVFHSGAPRGFAKKTRPTAPWWSHNPECKSRATFPVWTSSKSRPETSSPQFNGTCLFLVGGSGTLHKHPEASQQPEMVEFLPRLQLQRWTAEARDVRVDAFFDVLTSCRTPDGTRITRLFVGGFPPCVVQDRTLRKVAVSVRPTDVLVDMRTLKSEKHPRPIAQPPPSWEREPKWRQCLVHRNQCLSQQEDNFCLHTRVALRATAVGAAMTTSSSLEEFGMVMLTYAP